MFQNILSQTNGGLSLNSMALCMAGALVMGLIISAAYMLSGRYTKNFVVSLSILPIIVATIIIMVNGNLGTGVAIVGAFSLIRFRSVAGSSREICAVFFAMAAGLASGSGYVLFGIMFTVIIALVSLLLYRTGFGSVRNSYKNLKVTIPETLDYTDVFDDIFENYTDRHELVRVKTTNLGSLIELSYEIELRNGVNEKQFLDELRCRNGNLTIVCGRAAYNTEEL